MRILGYVIIIILLVLGITFALLNATQVPFHYYLGVKTLPLSLLIALSFLLGLLLAFLVMSISVIRLKSQKRGLKKRLRTVEQELNNLRALPMKD